MFVYHNENPNGYHIPDCVIRAITTATGMSYYDIVYYLKLNSMIFNCDELCVCCYEKLLDHDFKFEHFVGNGNTASDIAYDFCDDIILLRMDGHLSVSMYGNIHDIWDCSNEIVTDFWIVTT